MCPTANQPFNWKWIVEWKLGSRSKPSRKETLIIADRSYSSSGVILQLPFMKGWWIIVRVWCIEVVHFGASLIVHCINRVEDETRLSSYLVANELSNIIFKFSHFLVVVVSINKNIQICIKFWLNHILVILFEIPKFKNYLGLEWEMSFWENLKY